MHGKQSNIERYGQWEIPMRIDNTKLMKYLVEFSTAIDAVSAQIIDKLFQRQMSLNPLNKVSNRDNIARKWRFIGPSPQDFRTGKK